MKELDFDELDKAVNSLMSKPSNEPVADTSSTVGPGEQVIDTASLDSSATSVPLTTSADAQEIVSTEPEPIQSASSQEAVPLSRPSTMPVKRSGRFMDVVHPSSDMMKNTTASPVRQSSTLTPLTENLTAEPASSPSVADTTEQPEQPTTAESSTYEQSATAAASNAVSEWPDPLDLHEAAAAAAVTAEEPSQKNIDSAEPIASIDTPVINQADAPSIPETSAHSPFLTDAKVEKRPLGGGISSTTQDSLQAGSETSANAIQSDPADQTMPSVALPAELHDDLLKIESDTAKHEMSETDASVSAPVMTSTITQMPEEKTGPISIAQQYKQQPRTGDQSHAAVYDNAAQPLTHPAKQKSGWLAVIVIVITILIGGGGAAALFYLGYI